MKWPFQSYRSLSGKLDLLQQTLTTFQTNILKRIDAMSTTQADVQGDLDKLTALVNTTIPAAVTLINDLVAEVAALKAGQPSTLDPVKLEADIAALNAQIGGLGQVVSSTADPGPQPTPAPTA